METPSYTDYADDLDAPPHCICTHNTADPEMGCTCGYEDWLDDEAAFDNAVNQRLAERKDDGR